VEALAVVPPLTAAERQLWIGAADAGDQGAASRRLWLRPGLIGATAAAFLSAVGAWWVFRPPAHRTGPPAIADVHRPAGSAQAIGDVQELREGVIALGQELDDLRRRAELLDTRREVDELMARLAPKAGSSGL